ncbi:MAG: YHS domain-containing protein, partial [bacterium]|nr:YHS domain-containing protein [bacterium]
VCGMELEEGREYSRLNYKDKEYHFCSESCEGLFKKLNGLEAQTSGAVAESEKKMIAYNTLKQLTATVAHYIGNANTAISAQAQIHNLREIKEQSEKIEKIINALLAISDIRLQKYVANEEEAIFDLRNTLEDKLREGGAKNDH